MDRPGAGLQNGASCLYFAPVVEEMSIYEGVFMRILAFLLVASGFVAQAHAQAVPATTTTGPKTNAEGKLLVGYDGRGDYNKTRQEMLELHGKASKKAADATTSIGDRFESADALRSTSKYDDGPGTAAVEPVPATAKAESKKMRGDSALRSDGTAAKEQAAAEAEARAAAAAAAPVPTPAATPAPTQTLIVNGKVVTR